MLHCSAEATAAVNDSSKVTPEVQVIRRRIESSRALMHKFLCRCAAIATLRLTEWVRSRVREASAWRFAAQIRREDPADLGHALIPGVLPRHVDASSNRLGTVAAERLPNTPDEVVVAVRDAHDVAEWKQLRQRGGDARASGSEVLVQLQGIGRSNVSVERPRHQRHVESRQVAWQLGAIFPAEERDVGHPEQPVPIRPARELLRPDEHQPAISIGFSDLDEEPHVDVIAEPSGKADDRLGNDRDVVRNRQPGIEGAIELLEIYPIRDEEGPWIDRLAPLGLGARRGKDDIRSPHQLIVPTPNEVADMRVMSKVRELVVIEIADQFLPAAPDQVDVEVIVQPENGIANVERFHRPANLPQPDSAVDAADDRHRGFQYRARQVLPSVWHAGR